MIKHHRPTEFEYDYRFADYDYRYADYELYS
jgi:hypothetical protein